LYGSRHPGVEANLGIDYLVRRQYPIVGTTDSGEVFDRVLVFDGCSDELRVAMFAMRTSYLAM